MSSEPLIPSSQQSQLSIVVRFSDVAIHDLTLDISNVPWDSINTNWLRRMCRQLRKEATTNKRLKFIRSGRPLNSNTNFASELQQFFQQDTENTKYYVHCIVGQDLTEEELANEDVLDDIGPSNEGTTTQAVGFDRLRSVGFSDEEIELLREQFRSTYGDLENVVQESQGGRDIRQLEEQWMESGASDEDQFNSVPIADYKRNRDLLIGLIIGCLLGIFSLLLLKQEGLFSKRQKMAIVAGLLVNLFFGLIRQF